MIYRIVNTDNYGGDYPNESFVGGAFESKEDAEKEAQKLNGSDAHNPRYFKVVEDGYKLQPGFEP